MSPRTFDVILASDASGGWVATVPALPGCVSQGRSRREARDDIREAIALHLDTFGEAAVELPDVEHARVRVAP